MVRKLKNTACALALVAVLLPLALAAQDETPPPSEDIAAPVKAPANEAASPAAMTPPTLAAIVEQLSVESRKKFAALLATDWKNRPEWADMLISLLKGENMAPGAGWFKPSEKRYDWKWISERFDADSDGKISPEELGVKEKEAGSDQFFARLDRDNNGLLEKADFDYFGRTMPTPPLMMSQYLAALFDTDSNGRIAPEELVAFLKRADPEKSGFITSEDLYREFTRMFADRDGGDDMPRPERMLPMFFKGELGVLEAGPALGEMAPDFTLPTHDGRDSVTLSKSHGKPVILIFGSFT
jgi:Ca2+-binding EF-hand superfamily protein